METILSLPEGVTTHWYWHLTYQGLRASINAQRGNDGLACPPQGGLGLLSSTSHLLEKDSEPVPMGSVLVGRHSIYEAVYLVYVCPVPCEKWGPVSGGPGVWTLPQTTSGAVQLWRANCLWVPTCPSTKQRVWTKSF